MLRRREPPAGPAGRAALVFALEVEGAAAIDVYAAKAEAILRGFLGRAIIARGKLVDLSCEGLGKELWPASIRVATAENQVAGSPGG